MKKIFSLNGNEIMSALKTEKRQYLCGNLKKAQKLPFFRTDSLEVGITMYDEKRCDEPHYHTTTEDIIYVLKGTIYIMDINSKKSETHTDGDIIIIPVNTPYISKAEADSIVLFVKNPANYDKVVVDVSEMPSIIKWMES